MTRTHRLSVAAVAVAIVAGLAGCTVPGAGAAQPAVDAALEKFEGSNTAGNEAEVVGSYEWRDGYAVLLRVTGIGGNPPAEFENFMAYGVVPDGDSWTIANYNVVESASDPIRSPERAACLTLAEDQEEHDSCAAIEG